MTHDIKREFRRSISSPGYIKFEDRSATIDPKRLEAFYDEIMALTQRPACHTHYIRPDWYGMPVVAHEGEVRHADEIYEELLTKSETVEEAATKIEGAVFCGLGWRLDIDMRRFFEEELDVRIDICQNIANFVRDGITKGFNPYWRFIREGM